MDGVELDDSVPPGYARAYGIRRLRDSGQPRIPEERKRVTRAAAEEVVRSLKQFVFPYYGIRA